MTVGIICQARQRSVRLPGKTLAPVMGRPLLAYQLERLARSTVGPVIVATTTDPSDDAVVKLAAGMGHGVYRGSEHDVLSRYIGAGRDCDTIVRVTADCPLLDPAYIDAAVARFDVGDCDHLAPIGLPDGMGLEVVRRETLEAIYPLASPEEREHVTLYLRRRPSEFRLHYQDTGLTLDEERWTVDTAEDLELVRRILEALWPAPFTLDDIRRTLAAHPDWRALNAGVPMNAIEAGLLRQQIHRFDRALGDL